MVIPIFGKNKRLAEEKIAEGLVLTVAQAGKRIFVEYLSVSNSNKANVIIFLKDDDKIYVWHQCQAEKSNYQKSCWHLGLAMVIFGINDSVIEAELISPPDQYTVHEDISQDFLGKPGEFVLLKLKPEEETTPVEIVPESSYPNGDEFLSRYRFPKTLLEKVFSFREQQKQRLTPEQISRIPSNVNYIPQGNEVTYATVSLLYDTWAPPLLMGPKGSGKSTMVEALAEILYLPICRVSGGIDVNADYLLGTKTLEPVESAPKQLIAKIALSCAKSGEPLLPEEIEQISGGQAIMKVVHEPGILLQAVTAGEIILIDEINVLIPEVTSILHTLLDWQRTITVPGLGEVKAHPDFRLVAAMNVGYMGTRPLNNAFRDRFRGIQVQGISRNTLLELLQQKVESKTAVKLADIYESLYDSVYSPTGATLTESCISLRSLLRAAEEISMGIASPKDIIISCLTESIESESERTQVKDLVEMRL
jgi:MoxR-like ATPase